MANNRFSHYQPVMKAALTVVLLMFIALVSTENPPHQNKKMEAYMEAVLRNQKVMQSFVNCYLDKGPCSSQAIQGKQFFEEHFVTRCSNCSEEQKTNMKKLFLNFYTKYKEEYDKLVEKFDPKHENRGEFLEWITGCKKT